MSELVGREAEIAIIDKLVDQARDRGGSLLIRGEPGIGKSALLDRARARGAAMGAVTLTTIGVESEAELAYAGLHQLLLPVFELATQLPRPQRRAIDAVFGVAEDAVPDLFRVAMASFRLLTVAAESAPLLIAVDDAHWLDQSSVRALAFIARRLDDEPIALLVTVRAGYRTPFDDANLRVLELDRLSPLAAGQLLDQRAPDLHPIVRARVLTEAAGNPLALVELARTLPPARSAGERLEAAPTTLTARLERAFATRLHELPQPTRAVLLAAALDSRASVRELIAAASLTVGAPVETADIDPAIDTGFVELVGGELRFRHPLMRSAVRQAASSREVVEMYGALAKSVSDAERRLWHRAMAATGADEHIARDLESYARSAMGRGAVTVAATALERAVALTADTHIKGKRLVATAELAYELGRTEVVSRLVQEARPLELDAHYSARLTWLNQMTTGDVWFEPGAAKTFVTIAGAIADGGDPDSALRSLVPVAHRSWWTRPRPTTRRYLVDAARSLASRNDDPRVLAVEALADPEANGPRVLRAIRRLRTHDITDAVDAMYIGIAAEKAGDFALGSRFLARAVAGLREQTRLGLLTQALVHQAWAATYADEWSVAAAAASEGAVLARDTNQPQFGLTSELVGAIVSAMRGTDADVDGRLAAPENAELAIKGGPLLAPAHIAKAAAALGDGRHEDAFRELWPVFDEGSDAYHRFMRWPTVVDVVEAAVGSGQVARVAAVVEELENVARRSEPPVLLAGLACARPLLASEADAESLFDNALAQDLTAYPFLRARTLFSFGRWLRRQRRSTDSRAPLRRSIELFDALGAARWGARARDVLRATGETVARRALDARDQLTAQEMQIAQLAAQGLSNREIAERLFVSHRTIGSHLYHIFPKLGITARTQLRDILATSTND